MKFGVGCAEASVVTAPPPVDTFETVPSMASVQYTLVASTVRPAGSSRSVAIAIGSHCPPEHPTPLNRHECPQEPQLLLSLCRLTHSLDAGQYVYPDEQLTPQLVPSHVGLPLPFAGPEHGVHAVPQLVAAMLLSHVPPQSWDPPGHRHFPF